MSHRRADGLSHLVWTPLHQIQRTRRELEKMRRQGIVEHTEVRIWRGIQSRYKLKEGANDTR